MYNALYCNHCDVAKHSVHGSIFLPYMMPISFVYLFSARSHMADAIFTCFQVVNKGGVLEPQVVFPLSAASEEYKLKFPGSNPFKPEKCPTGTYDSKDEFDPCPKCPQGTFSDQEGSDFCKECDADEFTGKEEGQTSCTQCPSMSWVLTTIAWFIAVLPHSQNVVFGGFESDNMYYLWRELRFEQEYYVLVCREHRKKSSRRYSILWVSAQRWQQFLPELWVWTYIQEWNLHELQ